MTGAEVKKNVVAIFDFDGTIADSLAVYLKLCNQYLKKSGRNTINTESFRALGVLNIAKAQKIPKWQLLFIILIGRRYVARNIHEIHPFPGIKAQIENLSKKHQLGIVTSNSRSNVKEFLHQNDMSQYFWFVESKANYFGKAKKLSQVVKKYNIKNTKCVYVGDETRDMLAAKQIGIGAVAVAWGFENSTILTNSQPDITITKVSHLSQKLSRFFTKN